MRAWRFHRSVYDPLDPVGAQTYGGRWNPKGAPVLYASLTFAGGVLELLAHTSTPRRPPRDHVASLLAIPSDAGLAVLESPYLNGWDHPNDYRTARSLTENWLQLEEELCLEVPSVPGAPVERNLVINTRHRKFGDVTIVQTVAPVYDARVWGDD